MLVVPQHVRISRPDHLTSLFRRFLDDQETIGVQPLPASLLVMLMLFEIASSSPAMSIAETTATALAGRANNLIRTRYHEPLSTALIARELHCNPDYLGRTFGRVYGRTLTEAIHQYRLKQARRLLLEDQGTVAQIAQACGFNDPGYFRRLFKRAEGVTPYAFRRLYAHLHVNTV
jgi:AraC-like DNA-binding protein